MEWAGQSREQLVHKITAKRLAAGESLLIECFDLEDGTLPRLLVQKAARRGAFPLVETKDTRITRELKPYPEIHEFVEFVRSSERGIVR